MSQSDLRALLQDVEQGPFDSEVFILKSENQALQKTIEDLENELAEAIDRDDGIKAETDTLRVQVSQMAAELERTSQ